MRSVNLQPSTLEVSMFGSEEPNAAEVLRPYSYNELFGEIRRRGAVEPIRRTFLLYRFIFSVRINCSIYHCCPSFVMNASPRPCPNKQ